MNEENTDIVNLGKHRLKKPISEVKIVSCHFLLITQPVILPFYVVKSDP